MNTHPTTTGRRPRIVRAVSPPGGAVVPIPHRAEAISEVCARHADALAAQAEAAQQAVVNQVNQLGAGDLLGATRTASWLRATLHVLSSSLGELHAVLDQAAHTSGTDSAS